MSTNVQYLFVCAISNILRITECVLHYALCIRICVSLCGVFYWWNGCYVMCCDELDGHYVVCVCVYMITLGVGLDSLVANMCSVYVVVS